MYIIPDTKFFKAQEFFPPEVIKSEGETGCWRLMDSRIIWTAVAIRKHFNTGMTINSYLWGGTLTLRGFRPFNSLVDLQALASGKLKPTFSSFTTQHAFGRALDFDLSGLSAEEVRDDIRSNPGAERYKYVTAVEDNVSWVHMDCRAWDKTVSGILFF